MYKAEKLKGTLLKALEKKSGISSTGNAWASQEFVITDNGERPNLAVFEVFGEENINAFVSSHKIGDIVEADCAINTREWNNRYYTSLRYLPPRQEAAPQPVYQQSAQQQMAQQQQTAYAQGYARPYPQQQTAQQGYAQQQQFTQPKSVDSLPF